MFEKESDLSKLRIIRDKLLAHNDIKYIRDNIDIWDDVGLKIGEINKLVQWISEVVNEYRILRGEPYVVLEIIDKYDVNYVFTALSKYIENNYSINDDSE